MQLKNRLLHEFADATGFAPRLTSEFDRTFAELCSFLKGKKLRPKSMRRRWLFARINWKFRINRVPIAHLYSAAARNGVTFNYRQKIRIQTAFDLRDPKPFLEVLQSRNPAKRVCEEIQGLFAPVAEEVTLGVLRKEVKNPSKLRNEKGDRPIDQEILLSCFAAFAFSVAEEQVLHEFFDPTYDAKFYEKSFWLQLKHIRPELYSRNRTLDVVRMHAGAQVGTYHEMRQTLLTLLRDSYTGLNNHGHLAIWLDPLTCESRNVTWEIASDIMLFAEKHDLVHIQRGYFRPGRIQTETLAAIPNVEIAEAKFHLVNEGFTYRDTFVCPQSSGSRCGEEAILLILQKNKRNETLVPCPACRSHNVQGNSYSSLGVRSWECRNPICPERSKYNRGKRYSFKTLLTQIAIEDERNKIPVGSVRSWMRDVQIGRQFSDVLNMLIAHYTLYGDVVHIFGGDATPKKILGRCIVHHSLSTSRPASESFFDDNPWFSRYAVKRSLGSNRGPGDAGGSTGRIEVIHGDAFDILASFDPETVDGAVTSPPYYNAREYSQWPNIYAYLYDMYGIARQLFRVLRSGSFYLYNIFDHFDNEKSVVYSAMGDKRLILSAYTVDLFRRAGFMLLGNVTWDKGHIEGRRGFNAGNFSPYYQSPFNCWEHVLIFWKPDDGMVATAAARARLLPSVLREPPVAKMVRGENAHGHSAPFPEAIPGLLVPLLPVDATVVDPFGGSATTGRALKMHATKVICIEQSAEYCRLALAKCSEPKEMQEDFRFVFPLTAPGG
ncbi:MAG: DNA methyltransferase [Gammaproteobacteria bacterium]|nr:DNA methyltransferase [Gammaproteobacteria bacterium]